MAGRHVSQLIVLAGVVLAVTMLGPTTAMAQNPPADDVTVVMTELVPFVIDEDGRPHGFYAEIWDEVASILGVEYDVLWVDSFGELLPAIAAGRAEIAIAPLAPTAEREQLYDFTSAVIASGPQLGVSDRLDTRPSVIRSLLDTRVLALVAIAIGVLIFLAHLIWLVERSRHEDDGDFHPAYFRGIWDGIWWSTVTATTVGYGDKAPKSFGGRLIALMVMLASLVLVGAFVSQVTSIMAEDLRKDTVDSLADVDRPVGVVSESSFATYVEAQGVEVVAYDSQTDVFDAVRSGEVDIVVANPYALEALHSKYGVTATGEVLFEEFETFGLAQGSTWREPINRALADLQSSGEIAEIIKDGLN